MGTIRAADAGEAEVQVAAAEETAGILADDRPPGAVAPGIAVVECALKLRQVTLDESIEGRLPRLARVVGYLRVVRRANHGFPFRGWGGEIRGLGRMRYMRTLYALETQNQGRGFSWGCPRGHAALAALGDMQLESHLPGAIQSLSYAHGMNRWRALSAAADGRLGG